VTQNVTLSTFGDNETTISWESNKNDTITTDGVVTLTATISKGEVSETKVFNLTVKVYVCTPSVTFDAQEGTTSEPVSKDVIYGELYGTLATTKDNYIFEGWWTQNNGKGTHIESATTVFITSAQTLYAKWRERTVGDFGQARGYIFYDKGEYTNGWRYLEAAPYGWYKGDTDSRGLYSGDNNPHIQWGIDDYLDDPPVTATAVGDGETNTANIVNYHDSLNTYGSYYTNPTAYSESNDGRVAAKVCAEYSVDIDGITYDDWFLPSKEELNCMYGNLECNFLGNFSSQTYWCSSNNIYGAYYRYFAIGSEDSYNSYSRSFDLSIRPVQAF